MAGYFKGYTILCFLYFRKKNIRLIAARDCQTFKKALPPGKTESEAHQESKHKGDHRRCQAMQLLFSYVKSTDKRRIQIWKNAGNTLWGGGGYFP